MKAFMLTALLLTFIGAPAGAAVTVGAPAPTFVATDVDGNQVELGQLKGKTVVLEWTNYGCPFVRKHYDTGNMQSAQGKAKEADKNLVWVGVISSAKGKEGYFETAEEAKKAAEEKKAHYSHLILDPKGDLGRLYGASTTPHMFIIDAKGMLVYQGAIDDTPSVDKETVKTAKNYVLAALADLKAGKPVETAETKPYGCSVKY